MSDTAMIAGGQIRSFVERIEQIESEIQDLNDGKKEVFAEAKGEGFDVKVIREIIKLRYGIGDGYTYTLEEVGRIFRVTRERVRQIEAKAVRKLRHPVRARQLASFLDGVEIDDDYGEF